MKQKLVMALILFMNSYWIQAQSGWFTPFEESGRKKSASYQESNDFYRRLAEVYPDRVKMLQYGNSDVGKPIKLVILSKDGYFSPQEARKNGKLVFMIMNGIHPGESCGVDASMMFVRDLVTGHLNDDLLDHVVFCIIPIYNVGGSLNRSCCTRANQKGPTEQGFRGNARNLDLNRDFAKAEALNTRTFIRMYQSWKPELFLDTHTSDGADYQYVMTLISTQKDKLHPLMSDYMSNDLEPAIYQSMKEKGFEMSPYVFSMNRTPESGIRAYLETPRYSTGYTALFNTIGFVSEAHMLKTFDQRVQGTYALIRSIAEEANKDAEEIFTLKKKADREVSLQDRFDLNWELDTSKYRIIDFKGYEASYRKSRVTGLMQLYYDESKPYTRPVRYYNSYRVTDSVRKPVAYIIPQAWREVIELLKLNGVKLYRMDKDTVLSLQCYYVRDVKTLDFPWEGHYAHTDLRREEKMQEIPVYMGDYVVFPDQESNRYIVEMLEPRAVDSWFRWNFFDEILMQKEYFSDYVFDISAEEILRNDEVLRMQFEEKKVQDEEFAQSNRKQLQFIYTHSPYYEKSHQRYPVYRLMQIMRLPIMN